MPNNNSIGNIIKSFRVNRNLTQEEVCKSILTRQSYAKIEHNKTTPNYDVLLSILYRMGYDINDFINENSNRSGENYYTKLFLKGLNNELSLYEVDTLYDYVSKNKDKDSLHLDLYGKVKSHLHPIYPEHIPNLNDSDKNIFRKYILGVSQPYSLNDLRIIANFVGVVLSYIDLIGFYEQLPEFSSTDYAYNTECYHLQVNKIYNNMCDIMIVNNDVVRAKEIIRRHENFVKEKIEIRYCYYIRINKINLEYMQTRNEQVLEELLFISKFFEYANDIETTKSIKYQYNVLKNNKKYDPLEALTPGQ